MSFKRNANIKIFIPNKKQRLELVNVCGCWRHWNVVDWREIDRQRETNESFDDDKKSQSAIQTVQLLSLLHHQNVPQQHPAGIKEWHTYRISRATTTESGDDTERNNKRDCLKSCDNLSDHCRNARLELLVTASKNDKLIRL